jgi:two-component system chemotaxis response regulator CheB
VIKILVVDDSSAIRSLIRQSLLPEADIQIVGTASDGDLALRRIRRLRPDIVTLDIGMPGLDGLAVLEVLRQEMPALPVIVLSSLREDELRAAVDALTRGVVEVLSKPRVEGGPLAAVEVLRRLLLPHIRGLATRRIDSLPAAAPVVLSPLATAPRARVEVVAIGASTGGPDALRVLLGALPSELAAAVLVVQHIPEEFVRPLAERLDTYSSLPVRVASHDRPLDPGTVYLAPGGRHLITNGRGARLLTRIVDDPPEHGCRPAFDPLLLSLARDRGDATLAVVLTGMGCDGLAGCQAVSAAGGTILAQSQASAVVWGMPGAVARAGLAAMVGDPAELAREIARRVEGKGRLAAGV